MCIKENISIHRKIASVGILFIYLCFAVLPEIEHIHHHSEILIELHSEEQEHDLCHIATYHSAKDIHCGHGEHIASDKSECDFCDYWLSTADTVLHDYQEYQATPVFCTTPVTQDELYITNTLVWRDVRGPPAIS